MVNKNVVHWINILTHAPGFYWLYFLQWHNWPAAAMVASLLSSCAMHASETKHGLNGMTYFASISNVALNIDRIFAVVLAVTCASTTAFWRNFDSYLLLFLALLTLNICGERTDNLRYYTCLHSAWHVGVFYLAGHILHQNATFASNPWIWFRPL